ncbi:uncharacterized protein LOC133832673 [Humulus lupulus]|uniref:uncharacterized protein LOC133832673 n=1 Tax=Humulus lupulus TaxID=3486 RepID=UPI002B40AB2F|nr:uncharacterized protein LOC133832673 [Humulus lupulus]
MQMQSCNWSVMGHFVLFCWHKTAIEINLAVGSFPLRYLGIPLRPTKWNHTDCETFIQKFRLKIQTWASRHLSFAGRIQLINSVLLGLRNYWMSIFILSQSVVKEVEKLSRGFLWGVSGQRSKLHLPSWQKVCLPKAYGGVGFREGSLWNRSVLAKYIWALAFKPDLLWVKWINSIYLKDTSFWNYDLKGDCSWYWRKLYHLKKHFNFAAISAAGMKGKFLSSKLYNSLLIQQKDEYFRIVWSRFILPKHRFMLWQVIHSQLLTRDNLNRLHIPLVSLNCPVCDGFLETHGHLFFDCHLSARLAQLLFIWLSFAAWPLDYKGWLVWLSRARNGTKANIVSMVFAATIYSIWTNRNRCYFEGFSSSVWKMVQDIKFITKHRIYLASNRYRTAKDQMYIQYLLCN